MTVQHDVKTVEVVFPLLNNTGKLFATDARAALARLAALAEQAEREAEYVKGLEKRISEQRIALDQHNALRVEGNRAARKWVQALEASLGRLALARDRQESRAEAAEAQAERYDVLVDRVRTCHYCGCSYLDQPQWETRDKCPGCARAALAAVPLPEEPDPYDRSEEDMGRL